MTDDGRTKVLLLAARQPEVNALLEEAGFAVDARRTPLGGEVLEPDLAIVFRGRLIGREQAATLNGQGIPVIEIFTSEPTSPSTHTWLRLSNRISKTDLVQIARSITDGAAD
jgi:hypothetical protein